jgi:glycosyltransferase involved in cell wall biosynthesis
MKVTFIATVYNEELTIKPFLDSLFSQSRISDEIIIVDGGSTDNTISAILNFKFPQSNVKAKIKLILKKGNRSVGRNEAIKNASNEIIACSDAGCLLDKNWLKNIIKPFNNPKVDVVAGYYEGSARTIFQKCLVPYVLVMPDKINPDNFLPAGRSIAFKKAIWGKVGGFAEKFRNNEDYVFARRLRTAGAVIVFEKKAIVYWMPRNNIRESFIMFYRFAKGDAESYMFRPKVLLIFLRYIIGLSLAFSYVLLKSYLILNVFCFMLIAYLVWSIVKNYKYVKDVGAIIFLPLIQFTSDIAVMSGAISGLLNQKIRILIEGLSYCFMVYLAILLSFRQIRSVFKPSRIINGEIVGHAQYFGYSLYFETILFLVFILTPIITFFILSKIRKYRE